MSLSLLPDTVSGFKKAPEIVISAAFVSVFHQISPPSSFFPPPSHDSFSSQERVIENLREQKEREDRTRLEELEQMRKENQELKHKLSALQPPNASQNPAANPGVTQNQRPDREVGTHESVSQNGCSVDDRRHQNSNPIQNKIQITAEEGASCTFEHRAR